jgi:hypothetical protein
MSEKATAFLEIRKRLDSELGTIEELVRTLRFQAAEEALYKAQEVYELLEECANLKSEIQQRVCQNRSPRIQSLETRISEGLYRREAGKREDGNVAFKCNWNDKGCRGICSDEVYDMNRRSPRTQCARSNCREYVGKEPGLECCYECTALITCSFGAGWDHDENGRPVRPRKLWHARKGKIALLTSIPPYTRDRLVVAAFRIERVHDDPDTETSIYGDKSTVLDDMLNYSIPFWRYHKNPWRPESQAWGQGLFRYVSDTAVLGILEEYREKKLASSGDTTKVDILLRGLAIT